jgi:hypothetical protein
MRSGTADENQRLIAAVFTELAERAPEGLNYQVFRLDDGVSFIHVVSYDDGVANVLPELAAFKQFQAEFADRVEAAPARSDAEVIGDYRGRR